ncbi:patatin-like phospholipase family protein [Acetobacter senegalensis]|uniref:patatin-like phospholipase family protein n=1 Tax=Acetobacter senegalensis TaxID=446692 RepID=UPI0026533F26|nr:patatin-like phospholipase family protein [Acetobacter senegalensis]MDN7351022.1 patatin-like phospholipase family protein [Acetobacter senegalensis]
MMHLNIKKYINNEHYAYIVVIISIVLLNSLPMTLVLFFDQGQEIIRGMMEAPYVNDRGERYGHLFLPVFLLAVTMVTMTLTSTLLWDKFVSAMSQNSLGQHSSSRGKLHVVIKFLKFEWLFIFYVISLFSFAFKSECIKSASFFILSVTYITSYFLIILFHQNKILPWVIEKILKKNIDIRATEEKFGVKLFAGGLLLLLSIIVPCIFFYTLDRHLLPAVMLGPLAMATAICELLASCALLILLVVPSYALIVTSVCVCVAAGWLFHANRTHGDVRLLPAPSVASLTSVRTQQADFAAWLHHVQPGLDGKKLVIVALASGGGIRAASFTSQLLGNLQDENPDLFFQHLYAVSGVSGGSIGVATVAGEMVDASHDMNFTKISENLSGRDLLTPIFYHLILKDFLCQMSSIARLCRSDRSSALDDAIMNNLYFDNEQGPNQNIKSLNTNIFSDTLAAYESLREERLNQGSYIVPAVLLFGATDVQTGQTIVMSSSDGLVAPEKSGDVKLLQVPGSRLRLGTAVSLSARFPLITAPGRIDLGHNSAIYLTDGGYSDNSGARAMLVLLRNLFDTMPTSDRDKLNLLVLQIDANPCHSKNGEAPQQECNSYLKPAFKTYFMADAFTAFESIRERNTRKALADLRQYLNHSGIETTFVTYPLSPKPYVIPLGWYISTSSQENIKKSIKKYTSEENKQVHKLLQKTAQGKDTADPSRYK